MILITTKYYSWKVSRYMAKGTVGNQTYMQNKDKDYCDMTMTGNRVHKYNGN